MQRQHRCEWGGLDVVAKCGGMGDASGLCKDELAVMTLTASCMSWLVCLNPRLVGASAHLLLVERGTHV